MPPVTVAVAVPSIALLQLTCVVVMVAFKILGSSITNEIDFSYFFLSLIFTVLEPAPKLFIVPLVYV